ncbi:PAS domain S-box protein [Sphingomonas sp. JC676]|uniref:ATP-binding protein n=1 Tax=Sphingomonas sp. JC676 TaxID=2768065 RepID=UPI0016584B82|nr:ATP-binding protein [Sphingomonas sp. JC676]MBC9033619.1 PAS domain S-box protein [Sphingomonas sp. JC676]
MTRLQQGLEALLLGGPASAPGRERGLFLGFAGLAALALVTAAAVAADVGYGTAVLGYLLVVLLFSLAANFLLSACLSAVALACLDFFFVEPRFTFQIDYARDLTSLLFFVAAALVVTSLVSRIRALALAQAEQARLLDLTHDCILVRDCDDTITYWNPAAEQLYGWSRQEALGRKTHELLKTRFPAPLKDIQAIVQETGRWEGELVHFHRDGTALHVASRWSLHRDATGRIAGTLETNNNITERLAAEQALRQIEAAQYDEAQRLSATGSFVWHAGTGETFWSDEARRIYGIVGSASPEMATLLIGVAPEDVTVLREWIERAGVSRGAIDFEYRRLPSQHLHLVAHVISGDDAPIFVGALRDVTCSRHAEQQLDRARSELAHASRLSTLGELSASIAHEVNQPITAVISSAAAGGRFLKLDPPALDEVEAILTRIGADGARAGNILHGIRALARKVDPTPVPLDLNSLVEEALAILRGEIGAGEVAVEVQLAPQALDVVGDRVQLQQVILNLAINAAQAMAGIEGPRQLRIISAIDGECATLAVRDSGPGLAPEARERVFDAFFTTKSSGMGMGLSVCRTIIEAHGGRIWVDDQPGPGATFMFSLPLAEQPGRDRAPEDPPLSNGMDTQAANQGNPVGAAPQARAA